MNWFQVKKAVRRAQGTVRLPTDEEASKFLDEIAQALRKPGQNNPAPAGAGAFLDDVFGSRNVLPRQVTALRGA